MQANEYAIKTEVRVIVANAHHRAAWDQASWDSVDEALEFYTRARLNHTIVAIYTRTVETTAQPWEPVRTGPRYALV